MEDRQMIARHWRGWTLAADAVAYESHLKDKVLPALRKIEGYKGMYLLRLDGPEEVEFVVVNLFESLDAVRQFAGSDCKTAIFEPEARKLLSRIEPVANHYEVRAVP
jgi:heme-degrading monooxygenase HmoA